MKKSLLPFSLAAVFLAMPLASQAQVATNVNLTTNYKFRGQDQSTNKPALQGGFDYAHASGLYVGNWNSSVSFATGLEIDVYGGYKGALAKGVTYDVGVLQYAYSGASVFNTLELYGGINYGPAGVKYFHTISDEYFGVANGDSTGYLDVFYNSEIGKGLTLNAHVGFTAFSSDSTGTDYADYKLGVAYDLGSGFSVGGAAVGATKKNVYGDINKARFIVTLTKAM